MSKTIARVCVYLVLTILLALALAPAGLAQSATPLAPGSIQVSRIQYDGNSGNSYVSPFSFPEIFGDQAGCNVENDICNIAGIQGSVFIDQFSAVPASPVAGTLPLPSTGSPVTAYPTPEPGSYITSSFSSKSEGGLMLSPNGNYLTYMGYQGADQLDDVSNSYSLEPSMQLVPNTYTNSSGVPYPFYDREVALIGANGLLSLTPIDNAFSGDNPRAAITIDGNEFYMGGNSDSTEYTSHGVTTGPGLSIGARCGIPEVSQSYQLGTYVAADRTDESAKKHIKDNNWRGVGIYTDANGKQQLYVAKGSGGNGDDGVFQVGTSLPSCTSGGTDTNATITPLFSAPATDPNNSNILSQYVPFGFWFANPTTLYVADEGYQNLDGNGNLIPDPLAGLEKWTLVNGTWTLQYTIQAGLNMYQAQNPAGYLDGNGNQIQSYVTGLRNMTGSSNGDGTVTVYAITGQYSSVSSGEPDPTSLVGITDSLAATTLPANEQFVFLQTSANQEVFRGVAYIPSTAQRLSQTITFPSVGTVTYGGTPITLAATATSGWPIAYTVTSGPATVSGNVLTTTGAGSVTVQADQSGNTEYSAAPSAPQTFTVNPEATTVSWSTPAPITYGTALSAAQLNATASVAGTFAYSPQAGTVLTAGVQTLSVTFTPTNSNYATSTGQVFLQVNQATPMVSWSNPAAITYGTALSGLQLNATANVAGSFNYTPNAGTVLNAGSQPLSVSFTPNDTVDYTTASAGVTLQVNPATQSISITQPAPASAPYNSSFTVVATASSGLPVTFTSSGVCSNVGSTYTLTAGAGTCTVKASQSGNGNYLAAATLTESTTATEANQTVSFTGAPAMAPYASTFTVVATSNSGITPIITTSSACSISGTTVTMQSSTGTCTLTAVWNGNGNYKLASATQSTTAEKATPVITWAAPASITYPTPISSTQLNPAANVPGTFTYTPGSGKVENAGTYTLVATFHPSGTNYTMATGSVPLQVLATATTTSITSASATITMNSYDIAAVVLAFNVTSYKPTGAVTLTASTGEVCSGSVNPTTGNGSCKLTFDTTGTRTITASYDGDINHTASNSSGQNPPVTVTVDPH